jgi:hypothetical protein
MVRFRISMCLFTIALVVPFWELVRAVPGLPLEAGPAVNIDQ